jgi:hypothetical protein
MERTENYETIQDIYNELDDICGRFIFTNGKMDYKSSYEMLKKDIRQLKDDILEDNPEFQR